MTQTNGYNCANAQQNDVCVCVRRRKSGNNYDAIMPVGLCCVCAVRHEGDSTSIEFVSMRFVVIWRHTCAHTHTHRIAIEYAVRHVNDPIYSESVSKQLDSHELEIKMNSNGSGKVTTATSRKKEARMMTINGTATTTTARDEPKASRTRA